MVLQLTSLGIRVLKECMPWRQRMDIAYTAYLETLAHSTTHNI